MPETLELPNGETVTPDDVFLYNNYPYRVRFPDGEESADEENPTDDAEVPAERSHEFVLSPLYWGGGEMDVPFRDRSALVEQWGSESRGTLRPTEWEQWLLEVRHDERFGDDELDALARELPTDDGFVTRIRRALGL